MGPRSLSNPRVKRPRLTSNNADHRNGARTDSFENLPEEILIHIAGFLGARDLVALSESIPSWKQLLQSETIWRLKCSQIGRLPSADLVQVSQTPWQDSFLREYNIRRNWMNPNRAAVVKMDREFKGKFVATSGDRLLTLSPKKKLTAWSLVKGTIIWERLVHTKHVYMDAIIVAINHSTDEGLAISVETGETLQTWAMEEIIKVAIHRDNVVSISLDGRIQLWNTTSETSVHMIGRINYDIGFLIFEDQMIIAAPTASTIEVWSLDKSELTEILPNEHSLKSLVFNEKFIFVSCRNDMIIRSWSLEEHHRARCVIFERNATLYVHENILIGVGRKSAVRVWDSNTMMCIYNLDVGEPASRITVQSGHLVAFSVEGRLKFWDITTVIRSEDVVLEVPEGCRVHSLHTNDSKIVAVLKKPTDKLSLLALDLSRQKNVNV